MNTYDSRPMFEKLRRAAQELREAEAKPEFKPVTQPPWISPWDIQGQIQQEKQP